ncbi:MAG: aminoglycoside phosphotransferase family protein, partial [Pseudomonas sp.]
DLATALERNCIPWLDLDTGGRAAADLDAVDALLAGYHSLRPLTQADLLTLKTLLPLAHVDFALAEIDYFQSIVGSRSSADIAYHNFLIGHGHWFGNSEGVRLLDHLSRIARAR